MVGRIGRVCLAGRSRSLCPARLQPLDAGYDAAVFGRYRGGEDWKRREPFRQN
jgi:hypothetical protein